MNQENHPKEVRANNKGANRDIDKELLGANSKSGEYLDGRNLRVSSSKSERDAAEKINGEQIVHSNTFFGSTDYSSIKSESVNNKKIEFWVDRNSILDPIITIDGIIVAKSDKIPFLIDFPLQSDKNESCVGGEIFVTDFNSPPMTFNIQDMIDSLISSPTKYFSDFNPSIYTVNLEAPLNIPIFKELVDIGGGGGLPTGSYMYDIRYVTVDGDRSDFSPSTPPIPVVQNLSDEGKIHPWVRTFGGVSNINSNTNYGIKLKFRVNNTSNFDSIEIRRREYNLGVSNVVTPVERIVARIQLSDGEISIKEFVDPVDSNLDDILTEEDAVNKLSLIDKAKSVRYHDKRLVFMNVEFDSINTDGVTFKDVNSSGLNGVPKVDALGKAGFKDPFNHTYRRRHMGGERYGYGAVFFDSNFNNGFVKPIPGLENFEFPNRRDEMTLDSRLFSYTGAPTSATNAAGVVGETYEIFDLETPTTKGDLCSYKNILDANGPDASKSQSLLMEFGCPPFGGASTVPADAIGYEPFHPVSSSDTDLTGHDYIVNPESSLDGTRPPKTVYRPQGFSPNYYTNGIAIGGIENIPSSVKGFSIVRTEAAGRVVAQGIGTYRFESQGGINDSAKKLLDTLRFHSADLNQLNTSLSDDIKNNPGNYDIQVVSALGWFSEIYNRDIDPLNGDHSIDMISYARILHDEGQINPTESGVGIPFGGKNYVSHNKYRNPEASMGGVFSGDGNTILSIKSFSEVNFSSKSSFFDIELNSNIYNTETGEASALATFSSAQTKSWHEPMYIVNIIQNGKNISDNNIDNYKSTGHFQKIESIIGVGNGSPNQSFELVDERWEDCIPDLTSSGLFAGDDYFVYMKDSIGILKAWMDVTFKTGLEITNIINEINTNGFYASPTGTSVFGLYRHENFNNRDFNIIFNVSPYFPSSDDEIIVKYDIRKPLSVYGGDSVVAENIFAPIDTEVSSLGFKLNAPFPFPRYLINTPYYIIDDSQGGKVIQKFESDVSYIRQMVIMFASESRSSINYSHNISQDINNQYFPLIDYVIRPNNFNLDLSLSTNNIFSQYGLDYGVNESSFWESGGFRFKQNVNVDYSYDSPIQYFSKPDFGFEEVNAFCTAVVWSLPRAVNTQDSPGLKTFTTLNRLDIADDQGEIKKAYDATTGGKGENLYAITEGGICLLLTNKSILSNIDATDLTTAASDRFISGEYWLSKDIGSNDEMWRGMGEGTIGFLSERGNIEKEVLFFPNKQSVYYLVENQIRDIGRSGYYSRLKPFLSSVSQGYGSFLAGFINRNNNEYWLDIESLGLSDRKLFSYGNEKSMWQGVFDYKFDQYYESDEKIYGSRALETYELQKGFQINGSDIIYELDTVFAPGNVSLEKEFIRIGIQTGIRYDMKPTRVEFYNVEGTLLCSLDQLNQGGLFLKQYDGYEQFIGRKDALVSPNRERVQERALVVKIIHNKPEDFKVVTTTVQYKIIK